MSINEKVAYVRSQGQTRDHECHWPGCKKQVAPAKWGCFEHWKMLPKRIRDRIWAAFAPGQEISGRPSAEYIAAAREAQEWIAVHYPPVPASQQSLL